MLYHFSIFFTEYSSVCVPMHTYQFNFERKEFEVSVQKPSGGETKELLIDMRVTGNTEDS